MLEVNPLAEDESRNLNDSEEYRALVAREKELRAEVDRVTAAPTPEPTPDLPPEAVEAAARATFESQMLDAPNGEWDRLYEETRQVWRDSVTPGLRAALPFLPQLVSPSTWKIAEAMRSANWPSGPLVNTASEYEIKVLAERVLALLPGPTVAQVRRETLAPILALVDDLREFVDVTVGEREPDEIDAVAVYEGLNARINGLRARAAEVVDPRG